MNKQILKLAKHSGLIQYESDGKIKEVEQFAEMIIQECIDLISPYTIKGVEMIDHGTHLHPIYVIKEHFGLEGDKMNYSKLLHEFKKEVTDYSDSIDPEGEEYWKSLTLGWAIAKGLEHEAAREFAIYVRYNTDLA
jgi:hypothetical protein